MKKIFIVCLSVYVICILASNIGYGGMFGYKDYSLASTPVVVDDSLLIVPQIKLDMNEKLSKNLSMICDSISEYDSHPYLTLSYSTDSRLPTSLNFGYISFNESSLKDIKGVYITHNKKPVYILDMPDSVLCLYNIKLDTLNFHINKNDILKYRIDTSALGYRIFLKYDNGDFRCVELYNLDNTNNEISILNKIYKTEIRKTNDKNAGSPHVGVERFKNRIEARRFECMKVNKSGDSIFTTLNGLFGGQAKDSVLKLPVFEFNNSFDGYVLKRLCDSVTANNLFKQLWITPAEFELGTGTGLRFNLHLFGLTEKDVNGVILNSQCDIPIFIYDCPLDLLEKFGIKQTSKIMTVIFEAKSTQMVADAFGYDILASKNKDDKLIFGLSFECRGIIKIADEPFKWLYDL